ncbi:MAG TPA: aminoglycoside phosphotransferase family protein [Streptosporangiaceae bacterium]
MTAAGLARYQAALEAACARAGLDARDAVVLHVRANAVYHLPREGVVARVRFAPGDPAAVVDRFMAAVRVTRWLRNQRFPAPAPVDLDQPVSVAGHVVSFWKYVTVTGEGRDVAALGQLIRRLHDLPAPAVPLPAANLLGSLRADLQNSSAVTAGERYWLLARAGELERQYQQAHSVLGAGLVHGDAHAGNLLHTPGGVVLGDWDSVCCGPRELDLVPTSLWWRFGRPEAEWDQFCAAYGVSAADLTMLPLLQRFRELRGLAAYVRNAGEPTFRTELSKRIAALRTGNQAQPWRAL